MSALLGGRWALAREEGERAVAAGGSMRLPPGGVHWSLVDGNKWGLVTPSTVNGVRPVPDWETQMESADQKQSQLLHMQWGLVKDQISQLSRDIVVIRQELETVKQEDWRGLNELKDSCDAAFGQVESRVVQGMQGLHSSLEAKHGGLRSDFERAQEQTEKRFSDRQEHLDQERTALERLLSGSIESLDQKISNEVTRSYQDHSAQERILNGLIESLDQKISNEVTRLAQDHYSRTSDVRQLVDDVAARERAAREQNHLALQDQLSQLQTGVDNQLCRHDERHSGLQAALESLDSTIRGEFALLQADYEDSHGQLRGLLDSQRVTVEGHSSSLGDMERFTRDEMGRLAGDMSGRMDSIADLFGQQRSEFDRFQKGQRDLLDECREQLRADMARQAAEQAATLERRVDGQAADLRDLEKRIRREIASLVDSTADDQAALRKSLEELDRQLRSELGLAEESRGDLRRQISRMKPDDGDSRLREMMDFYKAGMDKQFANIRDVHDGQRIALQSSFEDLEKQLRRDVGKIAGDCQGYDDELRDHRSEVDKRFAADRVAQEEYRNGFLENVEAVDRALKREIARLGAEIDGARSGFQGVLDQQRTFIEKGLDGERESREASRGASAASLKELEKVLRKELGQLSQDQLAGLGKCRDLLSEHKAEQRGQLQSTLEDLTKEMKRELLRHSSESKLGQQKMAAALEDDKASLDRHLAGERSAREDIKTLLIESLAKLEAAMRKEHARIGMDFESGHQALRVMLGDCKSGTDKAIAAENVLRDEQRAALLGGMTSLGSELQRQVEDNKAELRSTMQSSLESLDIEIRKCILQVGDDTEARSASLFRSLDGLDQGLRSELASHKNEQRAAVQTAQDDLIKRIQGLTEKQQLGHVRVQEVLSEHKAGLEKHMLSHFEALRDFQSQEKSERFHVHVSMQERMDIMEAQSRQSSSINRGELDGEIQRLWQAVDTHTHSVLEEPKQSKVIEVDARALIEAAQPSFMLEEVVEQRPQLELIQEVPAIEVVPQSPMVVQRQIAQPTGSVRMVTPRGTGAYPSVAANPALVGTPRGSGAYPSAHPGSLTPRSVPRMISPGFAVGIPR